MMESFTISELKVGDGLLGLSPLPGHPAHSGTYRKDLAVLLDWEPEMVISVVETAELARIESWAMGQELLQSGIDWHHLPIGERSTPKSQVIQLWPQVSKEAQQFLGVGGRTLVHCAGGYGRSGMMALRLMIDMGESPNAALTRLRMARPGAVETEAQRLWAMGT